jgi:plastocyanin
MRSAVAVLILAGGLGAAAQEAKPARPSNVGGVEEPGGGTVSGIVKWSGEPLPRKPLPGILGSAFCGEACRSRNKNPLEERWVFGKNGADTTLQNVLVYVVKGLEGKTFAPPKDPAVLDQLDCIYSPRVVGVMVGQTLEIRNSDATLHNVMANFKSNKAFNEGMSVKGSALEKVFQTPELKVDFRCVLHPWMVAWVHVLAHPYYAVTGEDGTFALKGLPPGEYEIGVVHEASRLVATPDRQTLKVEAGAGARVEFTYRDGAK